jgi:hypothetical protein
MSTDVHMALVARFRRNLAAASAGPHIVVLIGSVARGTASENSDVDLLVLSTGHPEGVPTESPAHVQYFTPADFLGRLREGDDFAGWCVRHGIALDGAEEWERLTASPEATVWPDWRRKLPHATRRLQLGADMLRVGDVDAASEETLYLLTHLGRALLLRAGAFPLSRPEMAGQLEAAGYPSLGRLISRLLYANPEGQEVQQAIRYGKKLLVHLDRDWFEKQFKERDRVRKLKESRRAAPRPLA